MILYSVGIAEARQRRSGRRLRCCCQQFKLFVITFVGTVVGTADSLVVTFYECQVETQGSWSPRSAQVIIILLGGALTLEGYGSNPKKGGYQ